MQRYKQDLDKLRGNPRVWLLFSHVTRDSEYQPIKAYLRTIDIQLDEFKTQGAFIYLYNLAI